MPTVVGRGEDGGIRPDQLEAVATKIEVPDHGGMKSTDAVSRSVELESREDLFRDGGAAHDLAPFQDENAESGPAKVGGGDEAVVARSDYDGIVPHRHRGRSPRIRNAASRPDAPVIPPPGWVPEPH